MKNEEELQPTTVTVDYAEAFQSIQGCAVILNSENNTYTFYNEDKCRTRVSPNSTFKVISALIGIHNQVVTSEDSKMGYDGMNYPVDAWNADLRLEDAFRSSCIWYFRKVIEEVGQETIQEELNKLDYGNCDISEWSGSGVNSFPELNGFWIESSLLISPIEQVEVLHKIMERETIYTESEIEILKSIMLLEASDSKKIYGKTGTGTDGTAWFIGFVEKENTNIYFAIYLDDNSSNEISGTKAQEIAFNILEE
ncbi:penicillin-binding transpeptidase domain-containing protein [Jutongia sp.]|uniref:penicillin-binding transpeptidase domain-containing protein n=1 Tax=Jutongia sp. TaxID=2944204 RepID=UPI00308109C8